MTIFRSHLTICNQAGREKKQNWNQCDLTLTLVCSNPSFKVNKEYIQRNQKMLRKMSKYQNFTESLKKLKRCIPKDPSRLKSASYEKN